MHESRWNWTFLIVHHKCLLLSKGHWYHRCVRSRNDRWGCLVRNVTHGCVETWRRSLHALGWHLVFWFAICLGLVYKDPSRAWFALTGVILLWLIEGTNELVRNLAWTWLFLVLSRCWGKLPAVYASRPSTKLHCRWVIETEPVIKSGC